VDVFGNHGLGGLPEEGAHGKSPKCLGGNLGDFGEFCKGLNLLIIRRILIFHIMNFNAVHIFRFLKPSTTA
ncbi:TPA: hypothetical protein ACLA2I_001898, partial [Neisseria meningitidis]